MLVLPEFDIFITIDFDGANVRRFFYSIQAGVDKYTAMCRNDVSIQFQFIQELTEE
jgi:hypothetical protein